MPARRPSKGPIAKQPQRNREWRLWGVCVLLLIGAGLAWAIPAAKPNAVLGRLSYPQFLLATVTTLVAVATLVVALLPESKRRPVGFRVAAVLLSSLMTLAVAELALSLVPVRHQLDNPWYIDTGAGVADAAGLPYGRPAHLSWEGMSRGDLAVMNGDADAYARTIKFETDMEGFRNSRDLQQADFVIIGDSFTEAGNLMESETFTSLAGNQLGMSSRNLGRVGYTVATELIVLKNYALKCHPKTIVWQIAESNDLAEMQAYLKWVAAGSPQYFSFKPESALYQAWQQRSPTLRLFSALASTRPWPLGGTFRDKDGIEHPIRFLSLPTIEPPVRGHQAWPAFSAALLEGAAICRENHIRLLVVMIPTKSRVMAPYYSKLTEPTEYALRRPEGDTLGMVLQELCAANGIPFLDATDALQAEAKNGRLPYLPLDTHLSPLGHRIVADLIATELTQPENGLAPPAGS